MYNAKERIEGDLFVGSGFSHTEAMDELFAKLYWKYGITPPPVDEEADCHASPDDGCEHCAKLNPQHD